MIIITLQWFAVAVLALLAALVAEIHAMPVALVHGRQADKHLQVSSSVLRRTVK